MCLGPGELLVRLVLEVQYIQNNRLSPKRPERLEKQFLRTKVKSKQLSGTGAICQPHQSMK